MAMKVSLLLLLGAACMVSALTCPRIWECSAAGGSCVSNENYSRACNAGLSRNYTDSNTCNCYQATTPTTTPAPTYTLGAICEQTSYWAGHVCSRDEVHGVTERRWFSVKRIGDVCSADTAFDCYPPRKCVSGKCQGNLAIGATCYNESVSFSTDTFGKCVHGAYCETTSQTTGDRQSVATCIARRASGESCAIGSDSIRSPCAAGLECLNTEGRFSGMSVCGRTMMYYLDGGAVANSSSQCKSGLLNNTDGGRTCLSYDTLLALANTKVNQVCDTNADCGNSPDTSTISRCACDGMGTSNTARCSAYRMETPTELAAARALEVAEWVGLYNAGCETDNERSSYPTGTDLSNWCYRFEKARADADDALPSGFCANARAQLAAGAKDCTGAYSQICGALHTLRTSVAVLLALIVATILGSN